ncbi:MAG: arylsulfatase family protein [Phycisphaerales bacterium]|nr:arylsulfatase family protein [Phycisphaerales bacterium]
MFRYLLAVLGLLACVAPAAPAADRPPNVVLFFCDDMGYADVGCYGGKTPTPNIDRLAAEGARFTDFYASTAVCSASRAAILTGCYHRRVGIEGALPPKSKIGLSAAELTLPEVFKRKGYATGMAGKWHLGDAPQFLPTRHGFDEWFGVPYSHDMWPRHPANPKAYPDLPLMEGTAAAGGKEAVDTVLKLNPEPGELTAAVTARAVRFVDAHKSEPFFLYVPHPLPHVPLGVSPAFAGKTGLGLYADVIAEIDDSVGQVLAAVKRNGLDGDTLVLFSSDNGPWRLYGDHAGSAGPLREGKATSFDGGVREPFLARWPGHVPPGTVCKELAVTFDLLPTLAKRIGADLPADRTIDGKDIWPLMTGAAGATSPHEAYYVYWGGALQAVRSGRWKLHLGHPYQTPAPPGGGGKPGKYATRTIGVELFDLEADPGEATDVAAANPAVVERLQALAERAREDLGDAATKRVGKGVREPGRL